MKWKQRWKAFVAVDDTQDGTQVANLTLSTYRSAHMLNGVCHYHPAIASLYLLILCRGPGTPWTQSPEFPIQQPKTSECPRKKQTIATDGYPGRFKSANFSDGDSENIMNIILFLLRVLRCPIPCDAKIVLLLFRVSHENTFPLRSPLCIDKRHRPCQRVTAVNRAAGSKGKIKWQHGQTADRREEMLLRLVWISDRLH